MAVFSNLEGTMKKTFILGKNGSKLAFENGAVKAYNYQGTSLIPISAADPSDGTHLVTLAYFNAHSGGGSGSALRGTTDPDPSLGVDGDVYYKVDATNILQIYVKDLGIWKPFSSQTTDTPYVTTTSATPSEFIPTGGNFVFTLPASTHGRGSNIIVQLQETNGAVENADIEVDSTGNIKVTVSSAPSSNVNVVIIGATSMTTPYSQLINKANWTASGDAFTITIPQATHGQVPGAIFITVYQNTVDSATSTSPYALVAVETAIDSSGNVTLKSNVTFSGKVVLSGK
ncbi:putative structural protein [Erwinia phage pEa_SNUABM_50]|uniref:Structural protein n=4 Tax=Eneladusvirus BF TaxID=2560751 RepID=A0A1S6UAL3_9CAUD|nr:virion structural protein [Serratia phage BF]QOI71163.1 putative structural protein [Erwinia phage pEa_SNUABM_12]QOI71707.1 putative structural protein [Erwinia phage pEa_SNUABM_47]QOI72246.1 putative structural protein [Erwinia phage pEa_SNUABM_50]QXO11372.1 hypothetical protein pEaSNUABM19_00226 [Erwinia phage pEa_SNUABM_19]QXO11920.1 hypothetical protein pEaSNUABM44_00224 [Erwinia phage pEa_SNUABM_44]QXO12473.1 hypothetical protein pEaSNUABM49_00227 [Erwinia phage pEa_SNUABM_49]